MKTKCRFAQTIRHAYILPALIFGFGLLSAVAQKDSAHHAFTTRCFPETVGYERYSEREYLWNRLVTGETIEESKPASEDVGGNWGPPTDGLQMSVRLRRTEFLKGEPVVAVVILRNLAATNRWTYMERNPIANFEATLRCGEKSVSWTNPPPVKPAATSSDFTSYRVKLMESSQFLIVVRIDEILPLAQTGDYFLQLSRRELLADRRGFTNIVSGTAKFRLVEKLSPQEITATNALFNHKTELAARADGMRQNPEPSTPESTNAPIPK
jgi:hypothetical protein